MSHYKNRNMNIDLSKIFPLDSSLNEALTNSIFKAIKENSDDKMDYLKFKQSVKNLMDMNQDESTSFKSAFATASTLGLSKDELIKSILFYEKVINNKRDEFIDALKNSIVSKIEEPANEVIELEKSITNMEKEIQLLTQKIELSKQKITEIKAQVEVSEQKIEATKNDFKEVYESFIGQLAKDKENFENLI